MPKYVMYFKSGAKKEIPEEIYHRFERRVRRGEALQFPDGSLMSERAESSWDFIDVVPGEGEETHSRKMEDAPGFEEVIDRGVIPEEEDETPNEEDKAEPATEGDENTPPILTKEEFIKIFEDSGLSQQKFAEKIAYSHVTVHMARKEGRISQELSDKVREAFPPSETE
jgi:hypothetical protein